ncbi:MAG TPA: sigma 54-interacting transcriptional regulator, partial [Polyangiaceae bacterium]|nr:sigma 54-interacting transcriptional regulator [Polyangiaceae bacterium]
QEALETDTDRALDASLVAVPIKDAGRFIGVLAIERSHGPGDQACFCFDADVRLLTVIAHSIAQASRASELLGTRAIQSKAFESKETETKGVEEPAPILTPSDAAASQLPRTSPAAKHGASTMSGGHPRWRATVDRARIAAKSSSTVLLRGESGTGKEVLARYIHGMSQRVQRPFVSVNCAALAESVLESELFGHERGAFTGASAQRKGRFELADGGTLFLDEIGEISGAFQARLLRVLQLGEFERVGGMHTLKVDVRVLAATNRNLEEEVRTGRFRADLYYRISVVPLFLPALRERASDIPELATEFLASFNESNGTRLVFDPSALAALQDYSFPGNVRELENAVRRAASLASGSRLTARDFEWLEQDTPLTLALRETQSPPPPSNREPRLQGGHSTSSGELPLRRLGEDASRERLIAALEQAGWVQAKAARLLGLTPRQIAYALQKYQIPIRRF